MLRACRTSLLLLVLLPLAAGADVIDLGVTGAMKYESNVFGTSVNEVQSGIFSIGPTIGAHRDHSAFTYDLYYRPTYEVYTNSFASDLDGFDHFLRARLGYEFSERTRIEGSNVFRNDANVNYQDLVDPPPAQTELGRQRYTRNNANLAFTHFFDDQIYTNLSFFHTLSEYDDPRFFDDTTMGVSGSLRYVLDPRSTVGAGVGVRYQSVERKVGFAGSYTNFYNFFLLANHSFTPKLQLSFQGGPTLVDSQPRAAPDAVEFDTYPFVDLGPALGGRSFDASPGACGQPWPGPAAYFFLDSCPPQLVGSPDPTASSLIPRVGPDPGAGGETDWTFFGDIELLWEIDQHWQAGVSYRRQQGSTSRNASSVVVDVVALQFNWHPAYKWTFGLYGSWNQRKSPRPVNTTRVLVADSGIPLPIVGGGVGSVAQSAAYVVETVSSGVNIQQWYISLTSSRRLNKNSIAHFTVSYLRQDTITGRGATSDQLRAVLRFNYNLAPIRW